MRERAGRPQVRPYEWKNGDRRIPGAMVKVPGAGRQLWIDARDLRHVADGLLDALERVEAGRRGNEDRGEG